MTDGRIRVLPVEVANKIAAGEVVERPASVVKELLENAIDAGAGNIRISIAGGGRKLVAVQDDGCGMEKDDAVLSLERQATSKILDVDDIETIGTLGFRGEAIPSIASVSRFSITTRTRRSDEGTLVKVNAGALAEVSPAGCPPGTLVEVKDLFCNVPARLKFLRSQTTEENHIRQIFTQHALAHPEIGFSLSFDGREVSRLAPSKSAGERLFELLGRETAEDMVAVDSGPPEKNGGVSVSGFIERPNLSVPVRREQYVFVNSRPASAASIAYAIREAYPRRGGDARPAAVIFIELEPRQVDVNVHPTKREVRFRNNSAVKAAVMRAIENALNVHGGNSPAPSGQIPAADGDAANAFSGVYTARPETPTRAVAIASPAGASGAAPQPESAAPPDIEPRPVAMEFAVDPEADSSQPWRWFKFLAETASGYILIETDAGLVTVNPHAALERIAFERLMRNSAGNGAASQSLLIPEIVELSPIDFARIISSAGEIRAMGFQLEEFGRDKIKIDAVPQIIGQTRPSAVIATIARDLSENGSRRGALKWKEELIARSIARTYALGDVRLDEKGAVKLIEELSRCRMPYVSPRGKPVMIFTSTRELNRKFAIS